MDLKKSCGRLGQWVVWFEQHKACGSLLCWRSQLPFWLVLQASPKDTNHCGGFPSLETNPGGNHFLAFQGRASRCAVRRRARPNGVPFVTGPRGSWVGKILEIGSLTFFKRLFATLQIAFNAQPAGKPWCLPWAQRVLPELASPRLMVM